MNVYGLLYTLKLLRENYIYPHLYLSCIYIYIYLHTHTHTREMFVIYCTFIVHGGKFVIFGNFKNKRFYVWESHTANLCPVNGQSPRSNFTHSLFAFLFFFPVFFSWTHSVTLTQHFNKLIKYYSSTLIN